MIGGAPFPAGCRVSAVAPALASPDVDPNDPACFPTAHTLTPERNVNLALARQTTTELNDRPVPDLELHRNP
ncbi:hypothetical protein GCM10010178_90030 [Lentzea flava]|uniref:Uncharacterized protein n=1 Tax=Lentzea flava TaxID=103732 RepID=A0ABQ2VJ70_9PSEU|nr:hypothetical protein GCM10010178_90030 [Lentzea flava]